MRRPPNVLPSQLDICDPNFPTRYVIWTDQMRSEMKEIVAGTKATIAETRTLMAEIDRWNERK